MKILIYCQYVWGMGHLVRSLELARALSRHAVTLVAGGPEAGVPVPAHVDLVRLPPLFMDERFTTLIPGGGAADLASIKRERRRRLLELAERLRPDLLIVELFPFGRTQFGFELVPLLEAARAGRFGATRCVCSLRDLLVEKRDPAAYAARVAADLNRYFDLLMIHSDERLLPLEATFGPAEAIRIPRVYTGFVAPRPDFEAGRRLRRELGLAPGGRLVVASAGGGRSGYPLLEAVLAACRRLEGRMPLRLELFAGPFMPAAEFDALQAGAGGCRRVARFTPRLTDYLCAADLSVSLAGYNTCMGLLATGVPALVLPYARQQEQPLRVERLRPYLELTVLTAGDLRPEPMAAAIAAGLGRSRRPLPPGLDMDGAAAAARLLESRFGPGAPAPA
jgi:predicted glycosyltransferase